MKSTVKKSITIDMKLDSSEAVMFNQGGMHTLKTTVGKVFGNEAKNPDYELNITIQIETDEMARFRHVTGR